MHHKGLRSQRYEQNVRRVPPHIKLGMTPVKNEISKKTRKEWICLIRLAGRSITVVFSVTVLFKTDVFAGAQGRNVLGSAAICCLVSGKVFYCSPGSRWFAAQDLQHSLINGKIAHFIRCPARTSQLCTGTKHSRTCACVGEDFI